MMYNQLKIRKDAFEEEKQKFEESAQRIYQESIEVK